MRWKLRAKKFNDDYYRFSVVKYTREIYSQFTEFYLQTNRKKNNSLVSSCVPVPGIYTNNVYVDAQYEELHIYLLAYLLWKLYEEQKPIILLLMFYFVRFDVFIFLLIFGICCRLRYVCSSYSQSNTSCMPSTIKKTTFYTIFL